jgi:hypothetical protein
MLGVAAFFNFVLTAVAGFSSEHCHYSTYSGGGIGRPVVAAGEPPNTGDKPCRSGGFLPIDFTDRQRVGRSEQVFQIGHPRYIR